MTERPHRRGLRVDPVLDSFIEERLAPAAGLDADRIWSALAALVEEFSPRIRTALARRDELQRQLDAWHVRHPGKPADLAEYVAFLTEIGYLLPEPAGLQIRTTGVDPEIAVTAGPQLVVPLTNARFAANAANARWGSLYDALYGTDAIPRDGELTPGHDYNPARGAAVIHWAKTFLDDVVPVTGASHHDATGYTADAGGLSVHVGGAVHRLADPAQFAGYRGAQADPSTVILVNHGLHIELLIDRIDRIGADDPAGVADVVLESAVTTIMDLEDSVSVVDAADKVPAYENWLALMLGTLEATVEKDGATFTRRLSEDRPYTRADGTPAVLPGRSLLFVRHTGHAMFTDAVLDAAGDPIPEGVLDALVTAAAAIPDLQAGPATVRNSREGSVFVVKPKQHGPEEVAITVELFAAVERELGLPTGSIKIGIMDEERRTTVNLAASVAAAADRVVFINTGFLDRTGDEIHTSSSAGPFLRKEGLRTHGFIAAYEKRNVEVGLRSGFAGHAQIGKGMWAMTELMADMLEQKGNQLRAGASTAWVPSPTAATLHATHYHRIDVSAAQRALLADPAVPREALLDIPVMTEPIGQREVDAELDDNVQSILGYVVRWIDQGIGCSKVPNLADVALMEDRATLRISSQLLGNWLQHGLLTTDRVVQSLDRIAPRVDAQNGADPLYRPLGDSTRPSLAYQAARDLILDAAAQPNGYTEGILHAYRRLAKERS